MAEAKVAGPKLSFKERAAELEKRFKQETHNRLFIPTGSIGMNWAYGGGYQTGRIYEDIAWEGGGKTTKALHAVAECQKSGGKVVYIDSEQALDKAYAKAIGVDWDNEETFNLFQPEFGEDGFEYAKAMMETGEVRLLVLDSINGLLPKQQMLDPAGTAKMGLHARLMGQEIPKIRQWAFKYNVAVICISQMREKIGVMFGSPETTQGGHALKFWASGRTELRKTLLKEGDQETGITIRYKVIKNKVVAPYKKGEVPIVFGVGFDKLAEVIMLGKKLELLKTRAGIITYADAKIAEEDFRNMLNDNPEFYKEIEGKIIAGLNEVELPDEAEVVIQEL